MDELFKKIKPGILAPVAAAPVEKATNYESNLAKEKEERHAD
ncbi:hypothetical protein [Bacillus gaemokensis]|nr:hypothetical protein [Bacillus gaemokensis]